MVTLNEILDVDKKIRFAAKISLDGDFLESIHRDDDFMIPKLKEEKMARHVSLLAANHKIMDNPLGKSEMTITYRGEFASLLFYSETALYPVSIDGCHDIEPLARKILKLFKV